LFRLKTTLEPTVEVGTRPTARAVAQAILTLLVIRDSFRCGWLVAAALPVADGVEWNVSRCDKTYWLLFAIVDDHFGHTAGRKLEHTEVFPTHFFAFLLAFFSPLLSAFHTISNEVLHLINEAWASPTPILSPYAFPALRGWHSSEYLANGSLRRGSKEADHSVGDAPKHLYGRIPGTSRIIATICDWQLIRQDIPFKDVYGLRVLGPSHIGEKPDNDVLWQPLTHPPAQYSLSQLHRFERAIFNQNFSAVSWIALAQLLVEFF
jgi:hypothetical protein